MDTSAKRKRVVLTIADKVKIIQMLDDFVSYSVITKKFGIGKSTVGDIKKNREKILQFQRETIEMGMSRKAKSMKLSVDKKLDQALYVWFRQKRMEGVPVSGPILCEKAVELSGILNGETDFTASKGWEWRFSQRHGIRQLSVQGEKLSSDGEQAELFVSTFKELIQTKNLSLNQIFNCDETGLNFRLLPNATLASSFEKSADGRKKSKDRVTLNLCSSASGTIKLPLHLIGKAKHPRCFRQLDMKLLPVKYTNQSNAWMTAEQFHEWFHHDFVPYVQKELRSKGEKPNAVLLLDNCSAHPHSDELISDDGAVFATFLPPNVTALIQPMDQGVIQSLKMKYKKKLLRRLIMEDDLGTSMMDFLKGINMKVVIDLVHEAWTEITMDTLRRYWQKILPITTLSPNSVVNQCPPSPVLADLYDLAVTDDESPENSSSRPESLPYCGYGIWKGLRVRICHPDSKECATISDNFEPALPENVQGISDDVQVEDFQVLFQELGVEMERGDIVSWLDSDVHYSGVQTYTDNEICELVSRSNDEIKSEDEEDSEEDESCLVTNSDAARMFERCLTWLEHQPEATVYNTSVLRELHILAAKKRMQSLTQTKLDKYFIIH
jgi:hypothetical protein